MATYRILLQADFEVEDEGEYLGQDRFLERAMQPTGMPLDVYAALAEESFVTAVEAWETSGLTVSAGGSITMATLAGLIFDRAASMAERGGESIEFIAKLRELEIAIVDQYEGRQDGLA